MTKVIPIDTKATIAVCRPMFRRFAVDKNTGVDSAK
jgi:hypothetical protein